MRLKVDTRKINQTLKISLNYGQSVKFKRKNYIFQNSK